MKHVRSQVPLPPDCQPWIEIRKLIVMTASIPRGPAELCERNGKSRRHIRDAQDLACYRRDNGLGG